MIATLLGKVASQDVMLFQVRGDAETLNSIATLLLEISCHSKIDLIHTSFSNAKFQPDQEQAANSLDKD